MKIYIYCNHLHKFSQFFFVQPAVVQFSTKKIHKYSEKFRNFRRRKIVRTRKKSSNYAFIASHFISHKKFERKSRKDFSIFLLFLALVPMCSKNKKILFLLTRKRKENYVWKNRMAEKGWKGTNCLDDKAHEKCEKKYVLSRIYNRSFPINP